MITIHGTGCCVIEYLYPRCDFTSPAFTALLSKKDGDGGLAVGKLVFAEDFEKFAGKPFEKAFQEIAGNTERSWSLGGPAGVSIVHAAQVLGDRAKVTFYGARGEDETGDFVEDALGRLGFVSLAGGGGESAPRYSLKRFRGVTPRTDVFSDPGYDNGHGERTFVNHIAAAGEFGPGDLDDGFFDAGIVCFGGTGLTPKIHDSLAELLSRAKHKNAVTVVNLVYDFRSDLKAPGQKWKLGKNDDAYPYIDLLIADRDEAVKTSGCPSAAEASRWFIEKGCGAAVVTEGSRPVHLAAGKGIFRPLSGGTMPVSEAVNRELAAHPEKRGDTTGCGDNFAGGVIAGLAETLEQNPQAADSGGLDLREICVPGIVAGGYACFTLGGVFYEKYPGEKRALLEPFIEAYRNDQYKNDQYKKDQRPGNG
jgi:sugar/nucleoside kinase (ribokinase family)